MDNIVTVPIKNGVLHFNHTQWYEVWKAKGLSGREPQKVEHPLTGKKVRMLDSKNPYYTVEYATKHFYAGHYIVLLMHNPELSSRVIAYENINCIDPIIVEQIKENQSLLEVIG